GDPEASGLPAALSRGAAAAPEPVPGVPEAVPGTAPAPPPADEGVPGRQPRAAGPDDGEPPAVALAHQGAAGDVAAAAPGPTREAQAVRGLPLVLLLLATGSPEPQGSDAGTAPAAYAPPRSEEDQEVIQNLELLESLAENQVLDLLLELEPERADSGGG